MPKRTKDYRIGLLEDLKDPTEATHYLNAALRDSEEMFLVALRDVAEARQMAAVAKEAGVARETIYRMLSPSGNPTYTNLVGILRALGIEFGSVRPRAAVGAPDPPPFVPHIEHTALKKRPRKKREHGKREFETRERAMRGRGVAGTLLGNPTQYRAA